MTDDSDPSGLFLEHAGDPLEPSKTATRHQPKQRHFGCPWAFVVEVCRLTEGRATLVVAIYIYRRAHVCRNPTVTLPAAGLEELGITRRQKNKALVQLQAVGLIQIESMPPGCSAKVTLIWTAT